MEMYFGDTCTHTHTSKHSALHVNLERFEHLTAVVVGVVGGRRCCGDNGRLPTAIV